MTTITIPREVVAFLLGEGPLEGAYFGDADPSGRPGKYWWRRHIRSALSASGQPPIDIERLISECVPGGSICDPQQVSDALRERLAGMAGPAWQPIKVACSRGHAMVGPGMVWHCDMEGKDWTVVRPSGGRTYSPSALGGTPLFLCEDSDGRREIYCGDSIAGSLLAAASKGSEEGG